MTYTLLKPRAKNKFIAFSLLIFFAAGIGACSQVELPQEPIEFEMGGQTTEYDFSSRWIHVREQGLKAKSASNLILIPGLVSSSEVWNGVIEELGKTQHLHIVDVSGFAGVKASTTLDEGVVNGLVYDLAHYIQSQNLKNVTLMGHSMGGFTSLALARDYGGLIEKVITVDSLPFYPAIFNPAASVETVSGQSKAMGGMILTLDDQAFEQMQKQTMMRMSKDEAARAQILSWSLNSDRGTMVQAMHDLMTSDMRPDLHKIATDVHVIYAYDVAMGASVDITELYTSQYKDLKNVQLTRIENSFHFIMKDQPQLFLDAVQNALNNN